MHLFLITADAHTQSKTLTAVSKQNDTILHLRRPFNVDRLGRLPHPRATHTSRGPTRNPVALSTSVQESLFAAKPHWYVFGITVAADTSDDLLGVDGECQGRIFDDIERTNEKRGILLTCSSLSDPCHNTTVCGTTSGDSRGRGNSTAEGPSVSEPSCLWA